MTRIILISGKGGVGKTTVAAATALRIANRGRKTLVLSFDLAHSLRDSFCLGGLIELPSNERTTRITSHLDMKEVDTSKEIDNEWKPIYKYVSSLMSHGGLGKALSSELAMLPGMEDVASLLALDRYARSGDYEAIVLDCPPTASTLRFIGMASGLKWYANHRLRRERKLVKLLRPFAAMIHNESFYLPTDDFFAAFEQIVEKLDSIEAMLGDPSISSLRLVTNPDIMVVRETQRAFMYYCMYGMLVDQIVVNRIFADDEPYFHEVAKAQAAVIEEVRSSFSSTPIVTIPFLAEEVVGVDALERFATTLFAESDPGGFFHQGSTICLEEEQNGFRLEVNMPFVGKGDVEMTRKGDYLMLRVGTFKRHMSIPAAVVRCKNSSATMKDGNLIVHFWAA